MIQQPEPWSIRQHDFAIGLRKHKTSLLFIDTEAVEIKRISLLIIKLQLKFILN